MDGGCTLRYTRLDLESFKTAWEEIKGKVVLREPELVNSFFLSLVEALYQRPSTVFFLEAREGPKLEGFVIAQDTAPGVFIHQFWSSPWNLMSVTDELLLRTILWAMSLGKEKLIAETQRDLEALYRRGKFAPVATIVERKIEPELVERLMSKSREILNG